MSVDVQSTNQWISHYQSMRSQLPCSRFHILNHLSRLLIDTQSDHVQNTITKLFAKCLDKDFVSGSTIQTPKIENLGGISAPTLVINGEDDFVVDKKCCQRRQSLFKPGDYYKELKNGRHFFPFRDWSKTSEIIKSFIKMVLEQKQNLVPHSYKNLKTTAI